ncbi:hypothetical protein M5K25_027555 [Dendrobium thyrsiflorum]|uniref:Uncharacterized protein n=1 Tax=Dendrobium thyrsiflorum TaxID=117978 RepID=A0ABD0TU37_DENTH
MSENEVDDLFDDLVASEGKPGRQYEAIEVSRKVKGFCQAKNSAFGSCSSAASNEVQSTSSPIDSMASWFSAPVSDVSTDIFWVPESHKDCKPGEL